MMLRRASISARSTGRPGGFTLIELVITVAVVGILTAIAYPTYDYAIRKARRAEARTALMQLMQLEERYLSVKGQYLAFDRPAILAAGGTGDLSRFKWYSAESPSTSHYELSATACNAGLLAACTKLSAVPGTANVSVFQDVECGTYWLQSDGQRGNSGTHPAVCW